MAVVVIIGRRGSGKTTLAIRLLKKAHKSGRRVLAAYAPNGLPRCSQKIRLLSSLQEVESLNQAAVLVDDASAYLKGAIHEAHIRSAVVSARHRDLDLFFVYHNVAQTPPLLFSLSDTVIFFHLTDSLDALKAKLGFDPDLLKVAQRALFLKPYSWIAFNLNTRKEIKHLAP